MRTEDRNKIQKLKAARAVINVYLTMESMFNTLGDLDLDGVKEFLDRNIAVLELKAANREIKAAKWCTRNLN